MSQRERRHDESPGLGARALWNAVSSRTCERCIRSRCAAKMGSRPSARTAADNPWELLEHFGAMSPSLRSDGPIEATLYCFEVYGYGASPSLRSDGPIEASAETLA